MDRMKTKHQLGHVVVASGAGRIVCSCGWQSRVSDDGHMFLADYVSGWDIEAEGYVHLKSWEEVNA